MVIEAEDLIYDTKVVIAILCEKLGIDPAGVQYEWDALTPDQWPPDPIMQAFFQDLLKSSDVRRADKVSLLTWLTVSCSLYPLCYGH